MSDADMMQLYSKRILALAADIPHLGKLENADGSAMKRSPQCGSTVTAHVRMDGDRIADFGLEVRACALGQASASVLGEHVLGASLAEIEMARDQFRAMLKQGADAPVGRFADLSMLAPVKDYPARHASTLLAFEAAAEAVRRAVERTSPAGAA